MGIRGSKPGERRGGRKKGTPNKVTADLREMVFGALERVGGIDYLARQAEENPSAFIPLLGKAMPKELTTGSGGFHITVSTGVPPCDADRGDAVRANKD